MIRVTEFESTFVTALPETHKLLASVNLTFHPSVSKITLHGSRGLAGGYRPDSDVDLCLIVNTDQWSNDLDLDRLLEDVLTTTLTNWQSPVKADIAAVFDVANCDLKCFDRTAFDEKLCPTGGADCFGLRKIPEGASVVIVGTGVQVEKMYPCLTIWRNSRHHPPITTNTEPHL